jgi:UDP-2,3-diacylglucosamine hydrolase
LLEDPTMIDLYGTPTLLTHGDTLCTDDTEYQRFRGMVRNDAWQTQFLSQPLAQRKTQIEQLRLQSESQKRSKEMALMDVNLDAVHELLRQNAYPRLIHGHTHRPAKHVHQVDGHTCKRWVLGDWDSMANALRCDKTGIRWETITA